ncbi:MAG: hypothetical protein GXP54_02990 [Deltaproteobacteria bacterium]|nr:hypothetical protein [Deltaproteobacteria bacterium]
MLMATIRSRARRKTAPPGLLQKDELSRLLFRERERADRNHHAFSLVVFEVGDMKVSVFREFVKVLMERRRSTDEIGWFESNQLGVILAESGASGADAYLGDLREKLTDSGLEMPETRVFMYKGNLEETPGDMPS